MLNNKRIFRTFHNNLWNLMSREEYSKMVDEVAKKCNLTNPLLIEPVGMGVSGEFRKRKVTTKEEVQNILEKHMRKMVEKN